MTTDELAKLTLEQKRIRIAELCGWQPVSREQRPDSLWPDDKLADIANDPRLLPDYLNDLNAMHEAELLLTSEQNRRDYGGHLTTVLCAGLNFCDRGPRPYDYAHATAAQHADAFLLTLG